MTETTLRLRSQADLQGFQQWIALLRQGRQEMESFSRAVRDYKEVRRGRGGDPGGESEIPGVPGVDASGSPPGPGAHGSRRAPPPPGPTGPTGPMPPGPFGPTSSPPASPGGPQGGRPSDAWRYMKYAGATAAGIGLGASVFGFLTGSAETYLQNSKSMVQVSRHFREAGDDAAYFGGRLGFIRSEWAGLMDTLGAERDTADSKVFARFAGFSRFTGIDPRHGMGTLGRIERNTGFLGNPQLNAILGTAGAMGMGQGRLEEFLQGLSGRSDAMLRATGGASMAGLLGSTLLPGMVFGMNSPLAQGQMGDEFSARLNQALTGFEPFQAMVLQRSGVGKKGGPGLLGGLAQVEKGIYDPSNILAVAESMRGYGQSGMGMALHFAGMSARESQSLAGFLGSEEGIQRIRGITSEEGIRRMLAEQAGGVPSLDFSREAGRNISIGEGASVQMEGMRMAVGETTARAMLDMRDVMVNLAGMLEKTLGENPLELITSATGAIKDLTGWLKDHSPSNVPKRFNQAMERLGIPQALDRASESMSESAGSGDFIMGGGP